MAEQCRHWMHSAAAVFSGSFGIAAMGHSRWHFMQRLQASLTCRLNIPRREKTLKSAPSGQIVLHQNRSAKKLRNRMPLKMRSVNDIQIEERLHELLVGQGDQLQLHGQGPQRVKAGVEQKKYERVEEQRIDSGYKGDRVKPVDKVETQQAAHNKREQEVILRLAY